MRRERLAPLLAAALAGCSSLLPRSDAGTQDTWTSFQDAQAAIERIVPYTTTRADLARTGIEPEKNASITILTYSDVVQRFASPLRLEELDPGIRDCLTAGKACSGYAILLRRTKSKRIGNFWLDALNFERRTDITGWSFNALILFVGDTVVYTLYGGQPKIFDREVSRNPLGPLQGFGASVGSRLTQ